VIEEAPSGKRRIPVTVVTGFLGSGKTTLLQQMLALPDLGDAAVIINELGDVALDHHLIRHVDENVVVLPSGCVCCTVRDDLGVALRELLRHRAHGSVARFVRVIVETTGLADPVPIVHTLITEPGVQDKFEIQAVVTTVDAVNGQDQLANHPETAKQVALADQLIVTKTDLVDEKLALKIEARLHSINPSAKIVRVPLTPLQFLSLLQSSGHDLADKQSIKKWLNERAYRDLQENAHSYGKQSRHDARIEAFCLYLDEKINWFAFSIWLSMLLHSHGSSVLRVKGLLNIGRLPGPVLIQGVQHLIHTPVHLDSWPDDDHRSRVVMITRGIPAQEIKASLVTFDQAARHSDNAAYKAPAAGAGTQIGGRPFRRAGALAWIK